MSQGSFADTVHGGEGTWGPIFVSPSCTMYPNGGREWEPRHLPTLSLIAKHALQGSAAWLFRALMPLALV